MDEELACQLQAEEETVEGAHQGRDAATLEVVMEAPGLLTCSQLEGLGARAGQAHPKEAGPSRSSMAVAVQPPMVVA